MAIHRLSHGRVLDLTDPHILKSIGYVESQLIGPIGAITLQQVITNSKNLGYEFIAYREPTRPGRIFAKNLASGAVTGWKVMDIAKLVEKLCPNLLSIWSQRKDDPAEWDMIYPPVNTSPILYATVLEYLVSKFPDAVVAWVELALTYEHDLKMYYAVESIKQNCIKNSKNSGIINHVLGFESDDMELREF